MVWLFLVLSVAGLVASLIVHIASFFGVAFAPAWLLHIGIFVVFVPAITIARPPGHSFSNRNMRDAFRGAPAWVSTTVTVFFVYALVNFAIFALRAPHGRQPAGPMSPLVAHGFSGHWMLFY